MDPSLLRPRNLGSFGRPGTAASSDSTSFDPSRGPQRPKREPRRPPVSFRKPSSTTSLSASYQGSSTEDRNSEVASLAGAQRGRSNSITSVGSGRFKDLLDAQEEIRPIDYRTRLEATGARDHAEDVADRNMRQNQAGGHTAFARSISHIPETTRRDLASRSGRSESSNWGRRPRSMTSPSQRPQHDFSFMTNSELDSPLSDTTTSTKESEDKETASVPNTNRFSLHTYTPTGLAFVNEPGFTTTRDGVKRVVWPSWGVEDASRPQRFSPTGSNFSVPRSPKANVFSNRTASEIPRTTYVGHDVDLADEEEEEEQNRGVSTPTYQPSLGLRTTYQPRPARTSVVSNPNYRFSFASSITSRHTSGDYTALDHPKILTRGPNGLSDGDGCHNQERAPRKSVESRCTYSYTHNRLTTTLESRPQSQHRSEDESLGHIYTISSGLRPGPSASKRSSYIEDRSSRLHPDRAHEWELPAPSNAGSASTVSNPSYSGSSGRPQSRHTKATSVDSDFHPLSSRRSEESCRSTTFGQTASSPALSPLVTDFNIYDYISSDDESFTTERKPRRPLAEGEEDLLFKAGYGTSGSALPGLSESSTCLRDMVVEDPCPSPIVRDTRSVSLNSTLPDNEDDLDAVEPLDAEGDNVSVDRDLPTTFLRHKANVLDIEKSSKFGRRRGSCRPVLSKTISTANTETSCMSGDSEYYTPPTTANDIYMYDEEPMLRRGLQRLSAFGTWHGRGFVAPEPMGPHADKGESIREDLETCYYQEKEEVAAEEKIDISAAVRARKAAKAQKRAEDAMKNRQKRLTKTFGNLEQEIAALLTMQRNQEQGGGLDETEAARRQSERSRLQL